MDVINKYIEKQGKFEGLIYFANPIFSYDQMEVLRYGYQDLNINYSYGDFIEISEIILNKNVSSIEMKERLLNYKLRVK